MDQILERWDNATFNERLNYFRSLEMKRAKAIGRERCNIKVLDKRDADGLYDDKSKTIFIHRRFLTEPGTDFDANEAFEHESTHADQDFFRNNPEKCIDPHLACEYEVAFVALDFKSVKEVQENYGMYAGSKLEGEANEKGYNNTLRKFQLIDPNNPRIKEIKEKHETQKNTDNHLIKGEFGENPDKKIFLKQYDIYQEKVNRKQQKLENINKRIDNRIIKLGNDVKNQINSGEFSEKINLLKQKQQTNIIEIERLKTEKTLNPNLGKYFASFSQKVELIRQEVEISTKIENYEDKEIERLKSKPEVKKIVQDYIAENRKLGILKTKREQVARSRFAKYNPLTKIKINRLDKKTAEQQVKHDQAWNKVKKLESQLKENLITNLSRNLEYNMLKRELDNIKKQQQANFNQHNRELTTLRKEKSLNISANRSAAIKTVAEMRHY